LNGDYRAVMLTSDRGHPAHLVVSALSTPGRDFVAYLADDREVTDPSAGSEMEGSHSILLPAGNYDVSLYSPVTGEYSPAIQLKGGRTDLALPSFHNDIVVRARLRN
jgi:hypothetical protein